MFVIGRNVEVKVENEQLTIVCQVKNVIPTKGFLDRRVILATTHRAVCVPKTDLYLEVHLTRPRSK